LGVRLGKDRGIAVTSLLKEEVKDADFSLPYDYNLVELARQMRVCKISN
jgi:hypothetical protein